MTSVGYDQKPTIGRISNVDCVVKYLPVLLVAGIIGGEVAGLQFVFWPLYFKDSPMLRVIYTVPAYFGIFMLCWTWVKAIMTDPGVIETVKNLKLNFGPYQ
jgi:hypothetical protein